MCERLAKFVSLMSHELRTPLHGMIGPLTLLQKTPLNERQKLGLASLESNMQSLLKRLEPMLAFIDRLTYATRLEGSLSEQDVLKEAHATFLALIDFDLRFPLCRIIDLLAFLKNTPLNDHQTILVDMILDSTSALLRQIDDLLELKQLDAALIASEGRLNKPGSTVQ
ncbi:MAG: histidine kinase dimerization/phospho-acceptor domain-containing protein [Candidatus Competibacter denitrificans]